MRKKIPPMLCQFIILCLLMVACYIASYYMQDYREWLSNVLLSIGCGLVTGMVLYMLTNRRNSIHKKCETEYRQLVDIRHRAHELGADARYFKEYHSLYTKEPDCDTFIREAIERAYAISESLLVLPEKLFSDLGIDIEADDLWDIGSIEKKYRCIANGEDDLEQFDELLAEISDKMVRLEVKVRGAISARATKLDSLEKHSL